MPDAPQKSNALDSLDPDIERDDTYYFHDIIILVDQSLFKVPRFYLERESEVFRAMFQLPAIGDNIHGLCEEEPLRLDGINGEDFRRFLRVLYPTDDPEFKQFNLGEWTSVLKLADMWDMGRIKSTAIKRMEILMGPAERIVLGRQYHVDEWVVQGFVSLIERADPISMDDGRRIGYEWAFEIAAMREHCGTRDTSTQPWENRKPRGPIIAPSDCADHIRQVLGLTRNK